MKNQIFFSAIALAAFASPALAADIPVKAPAAVPYNSWTGFYVGATLGSGWSTVAPTFSDPENVAVNNCGPCAGPFTTTTVDQKRNGLIGGFHAGYNWQFSPNMLVGIEGDFAGTDLKHTTNVPLSSIRPGGIPFQNAVSNLGFQTDINWLTSIRGRLGYVYGNWMFYGTGGIAFADVDFSGSAQCTRGDCRPLFANASFRTTRTGWTAGAGTEWAFLAGWRARAEYLYYEFDSTNTTSGRFVETSGVPSECAVTPSCSAVFGVGKIDIHTARLGLSYAFRP